MDFPNMSYCAAENTNHAVNQIFRMMEDAGSINEFFEGLSRREQESFRNLIDTMAEIVSIAEGDGFI